MLMHVQQLSLNALCVKKQGLKKKPEVDCPTELKGNGWLATAKSATYAKSDLPSSLRPTKIHDLRKPCLLAILEKVQGVQPLSMSLVSIASPFSAPYKSPMIH